MAGWSIRARTWFRAGLLLAVVLVVDQVSKALVKDGIRTGDEDSIFPGITLVHTKNRGVAFSVLEGKTLVVVLVIALAMLALLVYVARHADMPGIWVPTGLLTGGAVGNIVDRVRDGAVTDFIKLPAWPAFNVADMAITFGVLALLYVMERTPQEDHGAQVDMDADAPPPAGRADIAPTSRTPDAADSRT
ncbi:MAG: lspA [Solirubrobacterales bacterium]|nr:lspA [Solirubrobacterales bacterium]